MRSIAVHCRNVVADALSRLVDDGAWSGSAAEMHAAICAVALPEERASPAWPCSAVALAACLRSQSDALRAHGLRMSVMPADVLIERIPPMTPGAQPARVRGTRGGVRSAFSLVDHYR